MIESGAATLKPSISIDQPIAEGRRVPSFPLQRGDQANVATSTVHHVDVDSGSSSDGMETPVYQAEPGPTPVFGRMPGSGAGGAP